MWGTLFLAFRISDEARLSDDKAGRSNRDGTAYQLKLRT
jgi:hypothetical protein